MNKNDFIQELQKKTNYDFEKCNLINNILEEHLILLRSNKEKIMNLLIKNLSLETQEAENIYDISLNIISKELSHKIKHPFKSI